MTGKKKNAIFGKNGIVPPFKEAISFISFAFYTFLPRDSSDHYIFIECSVMIRKIYSQLGSIILYSIFLLTAI